MAPPGIQVGCVSSTAVATTHDPLPPMHPAAMHAPTTTMPPSTHMPPGNRITDACENITLQQLRYGW